jgi:MFS family permease
VSDASRAPTPWAKRLPFFYGWIVVAIAFVTMAIGVNVRTSFSLLFPPILAEFGWSRGETAAAFSFGFFVSALVSAVLGFAMDRYGPRRVVPVGALIVASGLGLATLTARPWHLYLSLGLLVVGGSVIFSYIGHSMFLPHWFDRLRALAIGMAFSGVGIGSIVLFPWIQAIIGAAGWRQACWTLAAILLVLVLPLNFFLQHGKPEDLGLHPDGDAQAAGDTCKPAGPSASAGATQAPTLGEAVRTAPFWWICAGYFCGLFVWYLVQVHQTKYLLEIGFRPETAAVALGFVPLTGIAGQIGLGHLSDKLGREWTYTMAGLGFFACYGLLLAMESHPSPWLMYLMIVCQGGLGYGLTAVFGAIPAEIFEGRAFGRIFGTISIASTLGAGVGPYVGGVAQDLTGSYAPAFALGMALSLVSIACIWIAAPRKGPVHGRHTRHRAAQTA